MNLRWPHAPSSLAGRLALSFVAAFAALSLLFAGFQWLLLERYGSLVTHMSLQGQAEDLVEGLQFDAQGRVIGLVLEPGEAFGYDAFHANLKYRVLDSDGRVIASNEPGAASLLPRLPLAQQDGHYAVHSVQGQRLHVAAWAHTVQGQALTFQLARSDGFESLARSAIAPAVLETTLALAALAALAFAGVATWAVRAALRPVREAAAAARAIDPESGQVQQLPTQGMPAELLPLLSASNQALSRLEQARAAQQRFVANAAHELKTPLAVIQARLQQPGQAASAAELQAPVRQMSRLVQQLLGLAEAGDRSILRLQEAVSIQACAEDAAAQLGWKLEQGQHSVRIQRDVGARQFLRADAAALTALLRNLIDNAIGFAPVGSEVLVRLRHDSLVVEDAGPGVPAEDREHIFERFWRAPGQSREGAGLGLALCREIARHHGWALRCEASTLGGAALWLDWAHAEPSSKRD